ncbi:MAG: V-type ATPase subunit [Victivallales bacterium]|nr:V-type ATPase subunit [Victivallales bacterium]
MLEKSINLGTDFISSHLHAWWSGSAQGARLEEFARAATMDNFLHLLQSSGIAVVDSADGVTSALLVRHYGRLCDLERLTDGSVREYVRCQRLILESENLKAILNYRYFPERIGSYQDVLISFPRPLIEYTDIGELLSVPSLSQFMERLPRALQIPAVRAVIEKLDGDRNIMAAECALDNMTYQHELACAQALPGEMAEAALDLLTYEIDLINTMTLLRNCSFYRMSAEELGAAWMNGGKRLKRVLWNRLADERDIEKLGAQLPAEFSRITREHAGESLNQLENLMRRRMMRSARRYFYNGDKPALALPAYLWLLRFESVNLGRVFEGIRFSLPVRAIQEMLIE